MPRKIKFDVDQHKYFLGDREIPGVTTIMKGLNLIDDRWFTEESRETGTAVHEILELYDKGIKVEPKHALIGYLSAYQAFLSENSSLYVKEIEKTVYEPNMSYCGKLDRIMINCDTGQKFLIDIKTGAPLRNHKLQCSAYALAARDKSLLIGGLYLTADGKYKFKLYPRMDSVWRSVMKVYNFKERR